MKILVVDDEALLVKGIRFNLQNEGYEVITGSNGLEAIKQVFHFGTQINSADNKQDFHICARNPLYFANMEDSEAMEEYCSAGVPYESMLVSFEKFFGNDEEYIGLKKKALE